MSGPAPVLIVGQGLAGTLLASALERAGVEFMIVDAGHAESASRVGAGLVNPVTGERWTVAADWAGKATEARAAYHEIERDWGVKLVSDLRIRRTWRSEAEAELVRRKVGRGETSPWMSPGGLEADAAWIEGAWRVDLPKLITTGRTRWSRQGRLREAKCDVEETANWEGPVIWCLGAAETRVPELRAVGGETLELAIKDGEIAAGWREDVVRHDGVWILRLSEGRVWAGASFVRNEAERLMKREELRASVRRQLIDIAWSERAVLAGRRMTSPDRMPRSGWLSGRDRCEGVINGLGSKGALLAPGLAADWVTRLRAAR